jgi:uncharacterized protein (TIGR03437 family)
MPYFLRLLFVCTVAALSLANSPAAAQTLSIAAGDGQVVYEGFRSTSPMVVKALDANGDPLEGVAIDFSVTEGDGSPMIPQSVTDSDGLAGTYYIATVFTTAASIKAVRVTASSPLGSVVFRVTASIIRLPGGSPAAPPLSRLLAPTLAAPPLEGETGTVLPGAVRARVVVQSGIQSGQPVPNVGLRIVDADDVNTPVPISCDGPAGMAFSDAEGIIECDLALGDTPGSYRLAAYVGEFQFTYLFRANVTGEDPGGGGGEEPPPTPLTITTNAVLPTTMVGNAYAVSFNAANGQEPYSWNSTGALPDGLSLSSGGVLSGTPTAAGTAQFTVSVTDGDDTTVSRNFTLTVNDPQLPQGSFAITSTSFPNGVVGEQYTAPVITTGGCVSPFNPPMFSVSAGTLPPGLGLVSGVIRGTPTQAGIFQLTVTANDACGASSQRIFLISVSTEGGEDPPPSIDVSPASLTFDVKAGEPAAAAAQSVALSTDGSETFTASAATFSGGAWLQVSPSSGTTPTSLQVSVSNTAGLSAGSYQGEITVIPTGGTGAGASRVSVTLVVTAGPRLQVSPRSLSFVARKGTPPPTQQTITATSIGTQHPLRLEVETESGGQWLFATPTQNSTPANIFVAVSTTFMEAGTYRGTILVEGNGESETVNVVLEIEQPMPIIQAITNAATFLEGPIAPGELIVIFGDNLGPRDLVTLSVDQDGKLTTELGGVKIFIGLTPIPLLYVSGEQLGAIVPYGVRTRESMKVHVEYMDRESQEVEVAVAKASAGIFTLNAAGQGAILNQDGTVNGVENPAAAGSIVSIYGTGAGVMTPPHPDGLIIPATVDPLPRPDLPLSVEIGGLRATVHYAGGAPMLPNGMLQLNVEIPAELEPGVYDVVLRIGESVSPLGVTVVVN